MSSLLHSSNSLKMLANEEGFYDLRLAGKECPIFLTMEAVKLNFFNVFRLSQLAWQHIAWVALLADFLFIAAKYQLLSTHLSLTYEKLSVLSY